MRCAWKAGTGLLVLAALCLGGCVGPASQEVTDMRTAYAQGNYARSYSLGASAAQRSSGPTAAEAAYMAGMSAYKLGRLNEAQSYLATAANSGDEAMAGDALATRGLIFASQGMHAAAVAAFLGAGQRLTGMGKAHAYYYAGISEQQEGRWADARTHLSLARSLSTDAAFSRQVDEHLSVTGYGLQVGAFAKEANAQRNAAYWQQEATARQVGLPRVVLSVGPDGRQLYLVQMGQFSTYALALAAKDRLKNSASVIVVPLRGR